MTTKPTQRILRIVLLIGGLGSLYFVPWVLVKAWLTPLPDTVQAQVDESIGLGFDGMLVYVNQGGKEPAFYAAGWKNREHKIPANSHSLFKIASIGKLYDAVVVQFVNTTDFDGYTWNLSEIVYHRMVKILANTQST